MTKTKTAPSEEKKPEFWEEKDSLFQYLIDIYPESFVFTEEVYSLCREMENEGLVDVYIVSGGWKVKASEKAKQEYDAEKAINVLAEEVS